MNKFEAILVHSLMNMDNYAKRNPVDYKALEERCNFGSRGLYNDVLCNLAKRGKVSITLVDGHKMVNLV
jgi:hypothetical protein